MRGLALAIGVLAALGSGACASSEFNGNRSRGPSRETTLNGSSTGNEAAGGGSGPIEDIFTEGGGTSPTLPPELGDPEGEGASNVDGSIDSDFSGEVSVTEEPGTVDAGVSQDETQDSSDSGAASGSEGDAAAPRGRLEMRLSSGVVAAYRRDVAVDFDVTEVDAESLDSAELCLVEGESCAACQWSPYSRTRAFHLSDGPRAYQFWAQIRTPTGEILTNCASLNVEGVALRLIRGESSKGEKGEWEGEGPLKGARLETCEPFCLPGLSVTDSLGFYAWQCRDDEGVAVFRPRFSHVKGSDWADAWSAARNEQGVEVELSLHSLVLGTSGDGF